jgi:hypothetical protein
MVVSTKVGATLLALFMVARLPGAEHLPFPDKLVSAKTVYIQNDSGDSKFGDAMYRTLKDWGRWQILTDRSDADLIAVLDHKDILIRNDWTLTLIDPKTSEKIWSSRHDAGFNARGIISRELTAELRKRLPASKGS